MPRSNFERAWEEVYQAVLREDIPGAALGYVDAQGARLSMYAGFAAWLPERMPLERHMYFDLASLTKVLFTTHSFLVLFEKGEISFDESLGSFFRELRAGSGTSPLAGLTLRDLLGHISGLPAVAPEFFNKLGANELKHLFLEYDWPVGADVYSDVNFELLGFVLERVLGDDLRRLVPGQYKVCPEPSLAVSTEFSEMRGGIVIRGQPHDDTAFALGGMAGHAGLFGTIDAVLDFLALLVQGQAYKPGTLEKITIPVRPTRGMGWELAHEGWSGGNTCSNRTIGHTGFTGTGVWVDLMYGEAWTLLTNRVHPTREGEGIQDVRRALHDAIFS